MPDHDAVDDLVDQWRRERPDLDGDGLAAMATIGRLGRIAALAAPRVERVFAGHGLRTGEFDVLAALRRAGTPYTLTPSQLSRTLMLSPAAMTHRLDRLDDLGHVERRLDPENRRSILVTLTDGGRDLVDRLVTEHVANERDMLAALGPADRVAFDDLLRALLAGLETG
ncbi:MULTISPECIES: MarR family winged helix-turn-helix transcriptional regulator [unclassified Pseudonocardia]|uniref:MarR family winged helix-turn-helix transcriptional regulator n=1 Tax=unclassified Pseudonocardia TaxID=2619320 RepID=UPI001CF60830|nr:MULTISPECIES: MarR family transcriptional regulator [unclassified Pseudonocardia]